jgi:hypothetical protein
MRNTSLLVALTVIAAACDSPLPSEGSAPQFSAVTFTESVKLPADITVDIPCANGGAGELVTLSGNLHALFHVTEDGKGGLHVKSHVQPQGLTGLGGTTGAKYQATGVTQDQQNVKVGQTYTYVNNFRIIGQGPGNNFLVHQNVHVTVNANGQITAEVDIFRAECK